MVHRGGDVHSILRAVIAFGAAACLFACSALAGTVEAEISVGFIYVGARNDLGYNQAHAAGAAELKKLAGVAVHETENVPETIAAQAAIENLIGRQGARLIFATSYGYFDRHTVEVASKFPGVTFLHCGGLYNPDKHPPNVGTYFGYIDEGVYVSGVVAGHATKSGKLGFVAAKPIPSVLRNINAFTLGARSVNPVAQTHVIFTGDWSLPDKETAAARQLMDDGADVLACHVDSPRIVIAEAEKRGIYSCGYHVNQAAVAPKGLLTGAEWNWAKVYTDYLNLIRAGKPWPHLLRGGFKEGLIKMSPYGPAVSEKAKAGAEAAKARFMDGGFTVFKGPLKNDAGKTVIEDGKQLAPADALLESMDWLVEGVVCGKLPERPLLQGRGR